MISSVHLSPKMSRVVLIGHVDLLVIFFILKEYTNYLQFASMLPGELMVIKPNLPRKVRVLQKIDCQKEEL